MSRKTKNTAVRLDDDLAALLQAAADRNGHSLGQEMRNCMWRGLASPLSVEIARETAITNDAWSAARPEEADPVQVGGVLGVPLVLGNTRAQ